MGGDPTSSQRLDKWLWHARFYRSRSLAAAACVGGAIRIDGAHVLKAHAALRPGQVLTFVQGRHVRVIEVLGLAERRGPASEARLLYRDLSPPSEEGALPRSP